MLRSHLGYCTDVPATNPQSHSLFFLYFFAKRSFYLNRKFGDNTFGKVLYRTLIDMQGVPKTMDNPITIYLISNFDVSKNMTVLEIFSFFFFENLSPVGFFMPFLQITTFLQAVFLFHGAQLNQKQNHFKSTVLLKNKTQNTLI